MRRRIAAQLDTLQAHGVRHAVLSAFGCGAFRNPAEEVAALYREALESRREHFALIAFAVFHPGYGPDKYSEYQHELLRIMEKNSISLYKNYSPFAAAFDGFATIQ